MKSKFIQFLIMYFAEYCQVMSSFAYTFLVLKYE